MQTGTREEWKHHFEAHGGNFSHAPINSVTEAFALPQVRLCLSA